MEFRVKNLGYGKKRGGGGGAEDQGVLHMYHSGMQNANSQTKIFSDCTNDLKILCLL